MKLTISGHETVLTPELKKYATIKMNKLCKKYRQVISIEVVVEDSSKKTAKKIATARGVIQVAGPDITAEATEKTAFAAVDELERKFLRLLEKDKASHSAKKSRIVIGKNLLHKILHKESKQ